MSHPGGAGGVIDGGPDAERAFAQPESPPTTSWTDRPGARWILAACCAVAFAKLVDPQLWMMGLTIPDSAFGAAWQPYRAFSGINALTLTAFILLGGLLGDAFGRRRIILIGTVVALAANVLCLFSPGPVWFIAFRALEGFGSALAFPMTLAIIYGTFNARERAVPLLIYSFVTLLAVGASLLAIVLSDAIGWRATLILPICASMFALALGVRHIGESRVTARADVHRGIIIAGWSLALLALTVGLLSARLASDWRNPVTLIALLLGGLGGVLLAFSRRIAPAARIEPRLDWHQRHALTTMLLAGVVLNLGISGFLTQMYTYLTMVEQLGPVLAALTFLPLVLSGLLLARQARRLTMRADFRRLIAGGLVAMAFAMVLSAALVGPGKPYWPLAIPMAIFGFAFLLAQTAWNIAFLRIIPPDLVGASAGASKAAIQVGAWLGTAVLATVVLQYGSADFAHRLELEGLSPEQVSAATRVVDVALRADLPLSQAPLSALGNRLMAIYYEAYSVGFAVSFLWAAAILLLVAVLAWVVLRPPPAGWRPAGPPHAAGQAPTP